MSLELKSNKALLSSVQPLDVMSYINRVKADGGKIYNGIALAEVILWTAMKGLGASKVFSATSPSWGIKFSGDKPYKLYSLFGAHGDIVIAPVLPQYVAYDESTYGAPVIVLAANSDNELKTVGTASNVLSSGICVIAKTPSLNILGQVAGNSKNFALGDLADLSVSTDSATSLAKRMQSLTHERQTSTEAPAIWTRYSTGYGVSAVVKPTSAQIVDATKWSSTATFLQNGVMEIYDKGNFILADNTVTSNQYTSNLSFNIGRSKNTGFFATTEYSSPLHGVVAEAWCLVNITKEQMQAVSLRASQVYPS